MRDASVLGLGNFGTALANHLADAGRDVIGWTANAAIADGINSAHRNPRYQSDVPLDPRLSATTDLDEALDARCVIMGFPSKALTDMVPRMQVAPETIVVSAIKGIETTTLKTPLQFAAGTLPRPARLAVLSGPSFAVDVATHHPCALVAAADDEETARAVAELFSSDCMKVYVSTDVIGVELGGILKNVVAVAAGVTNGLGLGESARAALVTRGLAEMTRLAVAMGAEARTLAGLSGLGDLSMTAASTTSRNHTVGFRLGKGESLDYIIETLGSVAEGVKTAPLIVDMAEQHDVDMPIASEVLTLLRGNTTPEAMAQRLINRPLKREF
jgi:glycerol-3-phosphate dehydrogenase (NAD(P)+)